MNHLKSPLLRATNRTTTKIFIDGHRHVGVKRWLIPSSYRVMSTSSDLDSAPGANVTVPAHSQVVICGGGIIGSSVAFHLAQRGWTDVTVLEQGRSATVFISFGFIFILSFYHI